MRRVRRFAFVVVLAVLVSSPPGFAGSHEHLRSAPDGKAYNWAGWSVAGAGDVNKDGYDDTIVGEYGDDTTDWGAGRARVFSGLDGKVLHTFLGAKKDDGFGHSVGGVGDVNGDGYDDVIVGAPRSDRAGADRGTVQVFSGKDGTALYTLSGKTNYDLLGWRVSDAGDVNGDDVPDFMAGAPVDLSNMTGTGRVFVWSGKDGSLLHTFKGGTNTIRLGTAIGGAGDVNADGYDDLILGAAGDSTIAKYSGIAHVYSGKDGTSLYTWYGDRIGDQFGMSVDGAGDVDADGYDDLIIGSDRDGDDPGYWGRVYVYSGKAGKVLYSYAGNAEGRQVGTCVAGVGDLNLDGYDDFLTGGKDSWNAGGRTGGVLVLSGKDGSQLYEFFGGSKNDEFGTSAGSTGDVDGDGYPDLVVGAWSETTHGTEAGNYHIYDSHPPTGTVELNDGGAQTGTRLLSVRVTAKATDAEIESMRFRNDDGDWTAWEKAALTTSFTLSAGEGSRTVYAQFRDSDGWVTVLPITSTIVLDETLPTGTITLDGGADFTGDTLVTVALDATDVHTAVADLRLRVAGDAWSAWQPAGATAITLHTTEGVQTVEAQVRDLAGNVSETMRDTITLDLTPPSGSFVIEGGASHTGQTVVTLTTTATDGSAGVTEMRVRDAGKPWLPWEAFAVSRKWDLMPSDGEKTVEMQLRDLVGNESETMTASIVLDLTPPVVSSAEFNGGTPYVLPWDSLSLDLSAEDNAGGAGPSRFRIRYDAATPWTDWMDYADGRGLAVPRPGLAGALRPLVEVRDGAGNPSEALATRLFLVGTEPRTAHGGGKFLGATRLADGVDVVAVDLVEGDLLSAKVKAKAFAKKTKLLHRLDVVGPGRTRLVDGRFPATAKKPGVKGFPAPVTGRYLVILSPEPGTAEGTYKLTLKVKQAKANRKGKGVATGESVEFQASAGSILKASLTAEGLTAEDVTLTGPDGPVPLTLKVTSKSVKILPVILSDATGTWVIRCKGAGSVKFKWSVKLPPSVKGDLEED